MKTKINTLSAMALVAGLLTIPTVTFGELLGDWTYRSSDDDTSTTPDSSKPITVAENVDADNAVFTGFTLELARVYYGGSTESAYMITTDAPDSFADAETEGQYLSVKLSAAEGYKLDLDSFDFELGGSVRSTITGGAFTAAAQVRSSLDGFSSSLTVTPPGDSVEASVDIPDKSTYTSDSFSIALSGGFDAVDSIEFRVYGYSTDADDDNRWVRIGRTSVDGTVTVIPEPAAAAILLPLGCLLTALVLRRRNSRKSLV